MHWIQCDNGDFQNYSSLELSKYILLQTGTDWYILKKTANFTWSCAILPQAPTSQRRTPGLVLPPSFLPDCSCLHSQTTQAWLATAKVSQPRVLTSYTLLPRLPSETAVSTHPMGKSKPLCLLNLCGIVGLSCQPHTPQPLSTRKQCEY